MVLGRMWNLKKGLASKISNSDIDESYVIGKKAGARGGKILGSGGGGFLMFYCEEKYQENLLASLSHLRKAEMKFSRNGSDIIYTG